MVANNFSLAKFNKSLRERIDKQQLNFCQAITLSHRKISVTANYAPQCLGATYAALDADLSIVEKDDYSAFYYGCSPKIDGHCVRAAISRLALTSVPALEEFIKENHREFMLHKHQEKYLLDIAKLIVITLASKYGITLKRNSATEFILAQKDNFPDIISHDEKHNTIQLRGCPTQELLALLAPYRFKNVDGLWNICNDSQTTITDIYNKMENIKLLKGKVFYSGVLVKPVNFDDEDALCESDNIQNIIIRYERSTFATVCAFDENHIHHPLLAHCRDALTELLQEDEENKEKLVGAIQDSASNEAAIRKCVNDFLAVCHNVNQIGVSSNVKTSDGKVFMGLRGANTIDDGCLYPSVNGNAEVYDPNVSFYNHSVYEDRPSIFLQETRCDFLGEIAREAYGELRLLTKNESWECYGIVISGMLPVNAPEAAMSRRLHFNILFENEVDETFAQIKERKIKASESFENANFIAVDIRCYKNRLHLFFAGISKSIKWLLNSKDFIESAFLLLIAGTGFLSATFSLDGISSILSLIFASLILLTNLLQLYKFISRTVRELKTTKTLRLYDTMPYDEPGGLCDKISDVMGSKFHPVAYAAMKMHIENIVYDRLPEKAQPNAIIFGDSYSTFASHIPEGYATYYSEKSRPETDVTAVNQTWWHQVIVETNSNLLLNDSWSGSTIGYTGWNGVDNSASSSFIYRLQQLIAKNFFTDNRVDTVFVFGGTNDSWSNAPLGQEQSQGEEKDLYCVLPAIGYFLQLLRKTLPDAKIYFLLNNELKEEITACIQTACKTQKITPITFDRIDKKCGHPTIQGMKDIAEKVLKVLNL